MLYKSISSNLSLVHMEIPVSQQTLQTQYSPMPSCVLLSCIQHRNCFLVSDLVFSCQLLTFLFCFVSFRVFIVLLNTSLYFFLIRWRAFMSCSLFLFHVMTGYLIIYQQCWILYSTTWKFFFNFNNFFFNFWTLRVCVCVSEERAV